MQLLILNQTPPLFSAATLWLWIAVVFGGLGVFAVQSSLGRKSGGKFWTIAGVLAIVAALVLFGLQQTWNVESGLMLAFSSVAVFGAVGFLCFRQPVFAALGFAVSILASCGIYMMQSAPFLGAATAIIYAGATIIIFLFVLMFAQQSQLQVYDLKFSSPKLSILAGSTILGVLLWALQSMKLPAPSTVDTSKVVDLSKSLFGEYLLTIEVAGAILLVATIGAIVIAQRDSSTGESTRPETNSGKP